MSASKLIVLLGLALCAWAGWGVAHAQSADLVIVNARVKTMDLAQPAATAVAVTGGRIAQVGDDRALRALVGPGTQVIDAQQRVVLPGFIDTHMHPRPVFNEMSAFGLLDLTPEGGVASRDALLAKIAAKAAVTPKGALIAGRGYNDNLVGGHPDARALDAVSPDHPVILTHSSGHRQVVNSLALSMAGVTAATKDPAGGRFERDSKGKPTGIVLERASSAFSALRAAQAKPDDAAFLAALSQEFRNFVSYGVTSIADAGTDPGRLEDYRALINAGMPVQIYAMLSSSELDWLIAHRADPEWRVPGLKMNAVKVFHGNSLSGRTAWLYEPYAHDPHYYGEPVARPQAELDALILRIHQAGLQAAVHSNGDREIDMVLTAYERAQATTPRSGARHRIEHASVVTAPILARIKADNVALAPHSYVLNHGEKMEEFGAARWEWMHPNKRALALGIPVGGNSDHPVSPPFVMQRIESLVTRRARSNGKVYGPDQTISPDEALRIWTMGSAYLQFEETEKGSISPGKRADLVMLSEDPNAVAADDIETIKVMMTVIGGEIVFDRRSGKDVFSW
jgi:predicted amidohydrolase YtcJ